MNKEDLRLDYAGSPDIPLYQNKKHFCLNTDTVLLGNFIKTYPDETLLEIGCNNAALLLMLDKKKVKQLEGIEILKEPAKLAQYNMETFSVHPWRIYHQDVKDFEHDLYDVIASNPPFFEEDAVWKMENLSMRQLGRVEKNLTLDQLIASANRLLKSNGRFYMVHRPQRIAQIFSALQKYHFAVSRMAIAYDARDNKAKSLLIEAVKEGNQQTVICEPIWIGKQDLPGVLY